ncbi:DUF664 domain-containing protein [soil metagenome]
MHLNEALAYAIEEIRGLLHDTAQGLDTAALTWRPNTQANPIGWLLWHLTRVQDDHVSQIAGREQVWVADEWAQRFGLSSGAMDTGFGHSPQQVQAVAPDGPRPLLDYQDHVAEAIAEYVAGLEAGDFDRVIDRSYDPPVTVGIRLLSVNSDALQHVGQAAYVKGLFQRRA